MTLPLGLGRFAAAPAHAGVRATRTLWRMPHIAALCAMLEGPCPLLADLRLRCCVPPRSPKQLPVRFATLRALRLINLCAQVCAQGCAPVR